MTTKFDFANKALAAAVLALAPVVAVPAHPAAATGSASAAPAVPALAAAAAESGFALPEPGGRFAVGRDVLHLVDRSRPDPWVPADRRELMVSMYYPAAVQGHRAALSLAHGRPAQYLTVTEARLLLDDRKLTGVVAPEALSGTRTAARAQAQPRRGRYPLVVLSPGFTLHRHTLSLLGEELASRGYVVAAIDHAYESAGTAFPGGRVHTCTACTAVDKDDDEQERQALTGVATGRAQDVTFVLDHLTSWRHAGLIDRTRIGMAGHSIGGNAASATMAADRRVQAGVNMDGTFFAPVPESGLDGRPFLMLGMPAHSPGAVLDQTWDRDWKRLDGWKRWLTVTGTGHLDFCDFSVLADQAGLPESGSPLPGDRTAQIVRDYVTAFFDLHLRGIPQPLLDGPAAGNPEVVFHRP